MIIRPYHDKDEIQWLHCRVLSFLSTSFYDNVLCEKETYDNPSIELVAEQEEKIIGLIDIELEKTTGSVCSNGSGLGGMIWHIAIHPDHQRKGIGHQLLTEAICIARKHKIERLEAWTRDDKWVNRWYEKMGFVWKESYLQVFIDGVRELKHTIESKIPGLYPVSTFAHYTGKNEDEIRKRFKRVHETSLYELKLN